MAKYSNVESFTVLRHKFADDLEEIFQCMVCYERLSIPIPLCVQGHHVCHNCLPQMSNCPYCKSHFSGTRNYLAESLIGKFDEIKISLIEPHNHINKKIMTSIATQTDCLPQIKTKAVSVALPLIVNSTNTNNKSLFDFKLAPVVGKGKYPCKIGDCSMDLVHGRMISHLRYHHKDELIEEKITDSCSYKNSWEFCYQVPNILERAISIPNMGIFFLNVTIDDKGDLCGNLQIVNTRIAAQQFEYLLEVNSGHNSISYKGQVMGIRTGNTKNIAEKSLFINNSYLLHLLKKKKFFICNLLLNRIFQSEEQLKKE